jgi:hypothetical protein
VEPAVVIDVEANALEGDGAALEQACAVVE